jgi:hypothetical protein
METTPRPRSRRRTLRLLGAATLVLVLVFAVSLLAQSRWAGPQHEGVTAWPGAERVVPLRADELDGENVSGLEHESDGSESGALWTVRNNPSVLYKLTRVGTAWQAAGAEWAGGRTLAYPDGRGIPDAEALTVVGSGAERRIYVATERNNLEPEVSSLKVLRFDPATAPMGPNTRLTAEQEWDLTRHPELSSEPNTGFEGIAYVPDDVLRANRFFDESTGDVYDPADYGDHSGGVLFLGLEQTGMVYGYVLSLDGTSRRIATIDTGMPMVAELEYDADSETLWALCDEACAGESAVMSFVAPGPFRGTRLVPTAGHDRPSSMPNINNEGFTITSSAECSGGFRPVYWTDDSAPPHPTLRAGQIACS